MPLASQPTLWATTVWPGPVVSVVNACPVAAGTNHRVDRGA